MEKFDEKFSDRKISHTMKEMDLPDLNLTAFDWLTDAKIYNKNLKPVQGEWIKNNADVLVLLFTSLGVDKDEVLEKFYKIYETAKYTNVPIEVIFVPMDETENDMLDCYDKQANWFLMRYDDPLVPTLKFMYEVSCIPHIIVTSEKGDMISRTGVADIEEYGQNAIIAWISTPCKTKQHRCFKSDAAMYGPDWLYLGKILAESKKKYVSKFGQSPRHLERAPLRWPQPERKKYLSTSGPADRPEEPGEPEKEAKSEVKNLLENLIPEYKEENVPKEELKLNIESRPMGMDKYTGPPKEY